MNTSHNLLILTLSALSLTACRTSSAGTDESQTLSTSTQSPRHGASQNQETQSSGERKNEIIRDYPVTIERIEVRPYQRPPLSNDLDPVQFVITGTIQKNGKSERVQRTVEGVTLPLPNTTAREYLPVGRSGHAIYTERKEHIIAEIDSNGKIIPDANWKWEITYREYRYDLEDKVSALLFGVHVKNSEHLSLDINPR